MRKADLEAEIDGIGNVYGKARKASKTILIGSHTDTVPKGGWLDGALGVMYGLEIARCWAESVPDSDIGIDVISFQDEEGTYLGCLGSRSFCGELEDQVVSVAANSDGQKLTSALSEVGFGDVPRHTYDPERHQVYLEAHIEQGPRLYMEQVPIGIVTGIVGIRRYQAVFQGRTDHAGTTPMPVRKDAGAELIRYAGSLLKRFEAEGVEDAVWNIGIIRFRPGVINIVPGEAYMSIEFRHISLETLGRFEEIVESSAAKWGGDSGTGCSVNKTLVLEPVSMHNALSSALGRAAEKLNLRFMRIPSGAGHDAMILARYLPAAMLFVPSIAGRSHDIAEDTSERDIVLGAEALAETISIIIDEDKVALWGKDNRTEKA
jgi:N-carbamoyl-L-amino-acid hydrolase